MDDSERSEESCSDINVPRMRQLTSDTLTH